MQNPLIYIHGLPGSRHEIEGLNAHHETDIIHLPPYGLNENKNVLEDLSKFKVVSFSLGSMTALEIAAHYPYKTDGVILISPAAPLELGNFLPLMDGRYIFNAAKSSSRLLSALTFGQGLMAKFSPNYLMEKMFGESCEAERALLMNKRFRANFQTGLKHSLYFEGKAYNKSLKRFVLPWSDVLERVTCPVQIWHGTHDTWAPLAMGEALAEAIGDNAKLKKCPELGHYSTLHYAFEHCFQQ